MQVPRLAPPLLCALLLTPACRDDDGSTGTGDTGSATGGAEVAGSPATGGANAGQAAGGTGAGGALTGGAPTGGAGTGGAATGGASDGGEANAGQAAGGTGAGGALTGGTPTGGAGTGGAVTGGASDGGAASAGEVSGGAAAGGASSGGTPATGGAGGGAAMGGAATGGGPAGGAAGSGVYRPYSDTSPWNTPIGPEPALDPDSAALIADFEASSEYGEHLDVNIEGYSIPLYWADEGTPWVTVTCRVGGHGFIGDNGMDATAEIPLPAGAAPDPESDHHLLIIDRSTNTEYGMWDFAAADGVYTCGLGALQDLDGEGVRPAADTADPWWEAHGPRACGFGLIAGLIRPEEIEAGVIEHALVVAYPHIRSGFFVPPASTAQASNGAGAEPDRGIPCGGRLQYDPAIDVDQLDVSPAGKTILRALQIYGAYVGDYSGAISLYADNSPAAQAYWESIDFDSYELLDAIDLADFRVLEIGPLHDNGNG